MTFGCWHDARKIQTHCSSAAACRWKVIRNWACWSKTPLMRLNSRCSIWSSSSRRRCWRDCANIWGQGRHLIEQKRSVEQMKIIVAISGASGAAYGVRLLQVLRELGGVQTHLIVSAAGWLNLQQELEMGRAAVESLADLAYPVDDVGAAIASGSFQCDAMVIAPCSMRTLAAVALGLSDNLITRAADVMLKERRLSLIHISEPTRRTPTSYA